MSRKIQSVEVKITLGDGIDVACRRLGLDAAKADAYDLWFCEVVRLDGGIAQSTLSAWDLILRLRSHGDADDSTVKLRRREPIGLPSGWDRRLGRTEAKYEGDWSGDNQFQSASLTLELPAGSVAELVHRWPPLPGALLSAAQVRFAAAVSGRSGHLVRAAQPLGPVAALKWRGVPGLPAVKGSGSGGAKEVYAERWRIGTLDFLELSIQAKAATASRWQERFTASVSETIGLEGGSGATKTQLILEHLLGRSTRPDA